MYIFIIASQLLYHIGSIFKQKTRTKTKEQQERERKNSRRERERERERKKKPVLECIPLSFFLKRFVLF
jgi:hypothetical protein